MWPDNVHWSLRILRFSTDMNHVTLLQWAPTYYFMNWGPKVSTLEN